MANELEDIADLDTDNFLHPQYGIIKKLFEGGVWRFESDGSVYIERSDDKKIRGALDDERLRVGLLDEDEAYNIEPHTDNEDHVYISKSNIFTEIEIDAPKSFHVDGALGYLRSKLGLEKPEEEKAPEEEGEELAASSSFIFG